MAKDFTIKKNSSEIFTIFHCKSEYIHYRCEINLYSLIFFPSSMKFLQLLFGSHLVIKLYCLYEFYCLINILSTINNKCRASYLKLTQFY